MQKSLPYHKAPAQAFADAVRALSLVGSITRTNKDSFQILGKMRYGLQSVIIEIQIASREEQSLVTVKADGDDAFEVGAKSAADRFVGALANLGPTFPPIPAGVSAIAVNPSLVPCRTCGREISIEAATCPSCGAPNKWIHPKIEHFLTVKDSTGVTQPFTFNYEKLKISGNTEKKIPLWILWIAIVIFLLIFIPVALLGTVGLAFGPIGLVAAVVLALVFRFIVQAVFAKNKTFSMDFQSNDWRSNDDEFWLPVKALLTE